MTSARKPGARQRRKTSVGTKLAIVIVLLMSAVSTAVYFGLSRSMAQSLLTSQGETARALARLLTSSLSAAVVFEDTEAIEESLGHLAQNPDVLYAGVWSAAEATAEDKLAEFSRGSHTAAASVVATNQPHLKWGKEVLSLSAPVRDETDEVVAYSLIEFSLADENSKIAAIRSRVLLASIGLAALVVVLVLAVSRRTVLVPLRRLQSAAKRLEQGQAATFEVNSRDEVGELGDALKQMADAIKERESEITQRNREMRLVMDNVGQGFLTLDDRGVISGEHSRVVDDWFGEPRPGERFDQYLERVDPKTADWFSAAWDQLSTGFLPIELAVDQLPKRLVGQSKVWRLEYRPVPRSDDSEQLDKLIIIITDITLLLEKERAEREQREVIHALTRMTRDRQGFLEFVSEGDALVDALERGQYDDPAATYRYVHTLKGTAAVMDIDSVASFCHDLEESLTGTSRKLTETERERLREVWDRFRERIGPLIASRDEEVVVIRQEQYTELAASIQAGASQRELLEQMQEWTSEETELRLNRLAQHAQRLAERLDKGPLDIEIDSGGIRMAPGACGSLWNDLVHAIRNAIDHGLESQAEREALGKPPQGHLRLSTAFEDDHFVVTVADDGSGIDWEVVRQRAEALGLPHSTPAELQRALFHEGLSTRDEATDTSGRGFGTAALRATIQGLGGRLEVHSTRHRGTTLEVKLPRRVVGKAVGTPGQPRRATAPSP